MREQYGDNSFIFEIRKTFTNKNKAVEWENKVLRRMKVLDNPKIWLNRTNNRAILNEVSPTLGRILTDEQRSAIGEANRKRIISQETREKLKARPRTKGFSNRTHSQESREKISKSLVGRMSPNKGKNITHSASFKKGMVPWNKGIRKPDRTR